MLAMEFVPEPAEGAFALDRSCWLARVHPAREDDFMSVNDKSGS